MVLRCRGWAGDRVIHRLHTLRLNRWWSVGRGGVTWGVRRRVWRRVHAHAFHQLFETGLLSICAASFRGFDGIKQLAAFTASVLDKGLDVLLQAFRRLFHLRVELPSSLQAGIKVDVSLIDLTVATEDGISLTRERFVFVLFASHALILQKVAVCAGQFLHHRGLLMHGLQNARLMGPEFLKFRLEQLCFLAGCRLFVEDEDLANVIGVNLFVVSGYLRALPLEKVPSP